MSVCAAICVTKNILIEKDLLNLIKASDLPGFKP